MYIKALFNGRRVVAYGYMPNCTQATLKAKINGQELNTVVNCPDLCVTQGNVIHKLTAKSLIDDWQNGILFENDQAKNDLSRLRLKERIISLSKKYSITSEYTSFLAIEERSESERLGKTVSTTPQITDLLTTDAESKSIDILPYMEYSEAEQTMVNSKKPEDNLMTLLRSIDPTKLTESEKKQLLEKYEEISLNASNPIAMRIKYASASLDICNEFKIGDKEKRKRCEGILETFLETGVKEEHPKLSESFEELEAELERLRQLQNARIGGHLYVKTLTGKTVTIDDPRTVEELKQMIQDKEGLILIAY